MLVADRQHEHVYSGPLGAIAASNSSGSPAPPENAVVGAVRSGDQAALVAAVERYRPELRVHRYCMLGSFEEAEDLVQERLLHA